MEKKKKAGFLKLFDHGILGGGGRGRDLEGGESH